MSDLIFNKTIKNILSYFISSTLVIFCLVPFLVQAQGTSNPDPGTSNPSISIKIENPFKTDNIQDLIKTIVNDILMPIGGVVAVLMIMYAGFLFVTARGDSAQITKAKDALTWAVIGAAILLGAWVISQAISTTIDALKK